MKNENDKVEEGIKEFNVCSVNWYKEIKVDVVEVTTSGAKIIVSGITDSSINLNLIIATQQFYDAVALLSDEVRSNLSIEIQYNKVLIDNDTLDRISRLLITKNIISKKNNEYNDEDNIIPGMIGQ